MPEPSPGYNTTTSSTTRQYRTTSQPPEQGIRIVAGSAVAALAVIAGAVSYAHMRVLASAHGEVGWRAHAFPLSVDGIEIVASLVLLADRRVGRRSSWLVWAALSAGTAASMAANVAVGASDPVGRIVAGWPAFALLLAIKLLSGLIEHPGAPPPQAVRSRPIRSSDGPHPGPPSRPVRPRTVRTTSTTAPARRARATDVAELVPLARTVRAAVVADGGRLTRSVLADRLRQEGVSVSNARLTVLLRDLASDDVPAAGGGVA